MKSFIQIGWGEPKATVCNAKRFLLGAVLTEGKVFAFAALVLFCLIAQQMVFYGVVQQEELLLIPQLPAYLLIAMSGFGFAFGVLRAERRRK